MSATHDHVSSHNSSHRAGVRAVRGSAKKELLAAIGADANAVIISSQPTRLAGCLAMITAPVTAKTTGIAQPQPNADGSSESASVSPCCRSQMNMLTVAMNMTRRQRNQGTLTWRLLLLFCQDMACR